jgi:hypothetical protein
VGGRAPKSKKSYFFKKLADVSSRVHFPKKHQKHWKFLYELAWVFNYEFDAMFPNPPSFRTDQAFGGAFGADPFSNFVDWGTVRLRIVNN